MKLRAILVVYQCLSFTHDVFPSPLLRLPPSIKSLLYKQQFITTLVLNTVIGLVLMVLFEIKRDKKSVYAPRLSKLPHRASPTLPYGPLRWIWTVGTLPGPETLRLAGTALY